MKKLIVGMLVVWVILSPEALALWSGPGIRLEQPVTVEWLTTWGKKVGQAFHEPSPEILVAGYFTRTELESVSHSYSPTGMVNKWFDLIRNGFPKKEPESTDLFGLLPGETGAWFIRMKGTFRDDSPPSPPGAKVQPLSFNRVEFTITENGLRYHTYNE